MAITRMRRFVIGGATVGFVAAWIVIGIGSTISQQAFDRVSNYLLVFCPSYLGVMALDSAGALGWVVGHIEIALLNSVLYGFLGVVVYELCFLVNGLQRKIN